MKSKLKAGLLSLIAILVFIGGYQADEAYAATASVSVSPSAGSVEIGQSFSVTISMAASEGTAGSFDADLSYNANLFEFTGGQDASGGNGSVKISTYDRSGGTATSLSVTLQFTAKASGTGSFQLTTFEGYAGNGDALPGGSGAAGSVTVNPPYVASSNNALASLTVGAGSLTPAFSPDVQNYTVNLTEHQSSLAINATPADGKAKVTSVTGNNPLQAGANTIKIVVTAENGENRVYTITVNNPAPPTTPPTEAPTEGTTAEPDSTEATSEEESTSETESVTQSGTSSEGESTTEEPKGLVAFEKNGKVYSVAENFNQPLPDGFSETFYAYHDKQVKIGQSSGGVILMFVTDESGAGDFYVYNEQTKQFTPYVSLTTAIQTFIWDAKPDSVKVPSGFAETQITVGGKQVTAWKNQNGSLLVYVTTLDGKSGLYRFDQESTSFFPYVPDSVSGDDGGVPKEAYESMEAQYNQEHSKSIKVYIFLIILIVLLLAAIICLVVLYNKHKGGNGPDGGYDDGPYDDYDDGYSDEYYDDEYGQDEGIQDDYAGEEEGILSDMASDGQSADEGTGSGRPSDISQEKRYAAQPSVKRDAAFGDTEEIDLESLSRALSSNIDLGEQPAPESDKKSASGDDFEFMDV